MKKKNEKENEDEDEEKTQEINSKNQTHNNELTLDDDDNDNCGYFGISKGIPMDTLVEQKQSPNQSQNQKMKNSNKDSSQPNVCGSCLTHLVSIVNVNEIDKQTPITAEGLRLGVCKHIFCKKCIQKELKDQIEILNIFPPNCPVCHVNLESEEINALFPQFISQEEEIQEH